MRIAYCLPSLYNSGGMERVLTLKANYLAENLGYEVIVILTDGVGKKPCFELSPKIRTVQLDVGYDDLFYVPLWKRIALYWSKQRLFRKRLEDCLRELRPDITVSMLRREINFINSIHDGSVKVGEFHFSRVNYRNFRNERGMGLFRRAAAWMWMRQLIGALQKLACFVVLTGEDRRCWKELERVDVIPNPLAFFPEQVAPLVNRQVIAVGRYSPEKGYDRLIGAWRLVAAKHPGWKLVVYGNGVVDELRQKAAEWGIGESCEFNGAVSDIAEKYLESSILVSSSRYEGFGMVLTEAMACGVPVVAFDCPCGPKDIIADGVDGFLVKDGDIGGLAEKIGLLIGNEEMRRAMGNQARINAGRFRIAEVMACWDELFRGLVAKKHGVL